jgi:hypothetical protein
MKKVYIAHALSGAWNEGVKAAKQYSLRAAMAGYMPIAPYVLMDGILDDENETHRKLGMSLDMQQLRNCDEIWLCGERISAGMMDEKEMAALLHLKEKRFTDPLEIK